MDDCSYYKDWGKQSKEDVTPQLKQKLSKWEQTYKFKQKMLHYDIYKRMEAVLNEVESIEEVINENYLYNDPLVIDYLDTLNAYSVKH